MPQRYGDFATWTGSIGTVAAFAVAYYQIHQERRHRVKRELADRIAARREHADRVSAWVSGTDLVIANRSPHPIHDVDVTLRGEQPDDNAAEERASALHVSVVPPGEHRTALDESGGTMHVAHMTFTDSRADRWSRETGAHPFRVDARE